MVYYQTLEKGILGKDHMNIHYLYRALSLRGYGYHGLPKPSHSHYVIVSIITAVIRDFEKAGFQNYDPFWGPDYILNPIMLPLALKVP